MDPSPTGSLEARQVGPHSLDPAPGVTPTYLDLRGPAAAAGGTALCINTQRTSQQPEVTQERYGVKCFLACLQEEEEDATQASLLLNPRF